jgi:hypothetical protein
MTSTICEIEQEAERSNSRNTYKTVLNPEFRKVCDKFLSGLVADTLAYNQQVAASMNSFSRELFIRSTIESVLRIEMMRKINPLACVRSSDMDPVLCKQWGIYAADEGLHGRLFAKDLHVLGVTDEEIYGTKPLFATELLAGYCYQTLADEGPMGVVSSAYYVESVSAWTQPAWLEGMEKVVGREATRGARSHLGIDDTDHHVDLAWNMCMRMIRTPEDQIRFKSHLVRLHSLLVAYVIEVAGVVSGDNRAATEAGVAGTAIQASMADRANN